MIDRKVFAYVKKIAFQSIAHDDCGPDFYRGTAGQAWFLYHAGVTLNDKKVLAASTKKLKKSLQDLKQIPPQKKAGFYEGSTGIVATAIILAHKMNLKKEQAQALKLWDKEFLNSLFETQEEDIFSGWAGSILAFSMVRKYLPLKTRRAQSKTIKSWLDQEIPQRGFKTQEPGMAHGLAGIAFALRLFAQSEKWEPGLKIALFLEKHIDQKFNKILGGWESSQMKSHALESWCNGSSGIVIARRTSGGRFSASAISVATQLRLQSRLKDKESAEIAYCHGQLGFYSALDLLTKKRQTIDIEEIPQTDYQQGLITGHEGIAYYFLSQQVDLPTVLAGIN
jgi:lantibiotic modifying enzyme